MRCERRQRWLQQLSAETGNRKTCSIPREARYLHRCLQHRQLQRRLHRQYAGTDTAECRKFSHPSDGRCGASKFIYVLIGSSSSSSSPCCPSPSASSTSPCPSTASSLGSGSCSSGIIEAMVLQHRAA